MKSNIASVLCLFAHDKLMYFRVDGKLEPKFVLEGHQLGVISVDVNIGATSMFSSITCLWCRYMYVLLYFSYTNTSSPLFRNNWAIVVYFCSMCIMITCTRCTYNEFARKSFFQWLPPVVWTAVYASGTLRPANSVKPSTLGQVRAVRASFRKPSSH